MKKNKQWQNRPQQGQPHNNQQQAKVEQKVENAPLTDVADSAPTVEYATDAELASLCVLLDRLDESAQPFGDLTVEIVGNVTGAIRKNIETTGSLSAEDAAEIKKIEEDIAFLEDEAGCNSPFKHVSDSAYKALEEGTDEICVKWKEAQELIRTFASTEVTQMLKASYKDAIDTLVPLQIFGFVWASTSTEATPDIFAKIDEDFNAILNDEVEEPQPEAQPQIAAV